MNKDGYKILMLGKLSMEYVRANWLIPMQKLYDVVYVSVSVLCRCMSKPEITRYLLEIFASQEFDYVFIYPDGTHQMFEDRLFDEIKKTNTPIISFYSDDEPIKWFENNKKYDDRSNLVVTHSKRGFALRQSAGTAQDLLYLQWGYNPDVYYPIDAEKTTDVIFVGTNFMGEGGYVFDGKIRQEILLSVYRYCKEKGYIFKIYGNGWDKHPELRHVWAGFLENDAILRTICCAKIVLGLGYTRDEKNPSYHTKLKHFEIAGCRTFQIVNQNPDLQEIFGSNLGYFESADELCAKISYYLMHDTEREQCAARAYEICRTKCTMVTRIQEMIAEADNIYGRTSDRKDQKSERQNDISIAQIYVNISSGMENVLRLVEKRCVEEDITHIQILDENMTMLDMNDSLLDSLIRRGGSVCVGSIYSYDNENKLCLSKEQRRDLDDNAFVINGFVKKDEKVYTRARNLTEGFVYEDRYYPLSGFVFDKQVAVECLKAYKSGNFGRLLNIPKTDRIINDIRIKNVESQWRNRECRYLENLLIKAAENELVVIWGTQGKLANQVIRALDNTYGKRVCRCVFADRNVGNGFVHAGGECIKVIPSNEILNQKVRPKYIVITSVYSGREMSDMIVSNGLQCCIVPLYDIDNCE